MRVVVAEDHEPVLLAVVAMLEGAGHDVVAAVADGRAAIEEISRQRPEVVILDLIMGDVDGIDALREIRSRSPEVRVVIHTGINDPSVAEELRREGAAAVVVKSADPDALLAAVGGARHDG